MGDNNRISESEIKDVIYSLSKNNFNNVTKDMNQDKRIVEVFMKNTVIEPKGYVWPFKR